MPKKIHGWGGYGRARDHPHKTLRCGGGERITWQTAKQSPPRSRQGQNCTKHTPRVVRKYDERRQIAPVTSRGLRIQDRETYPAREETMSENITRLSAPMRALLLSLVCGSASILCGNSACDPVGGYNAPDQGGEKDMAQTPQDMETTQDMETMQDMETTDMFSEEDMSMDFGLDMPDLTEPMSCERVADCETGQQNVVASCDGTGLCSYQCTSESWAVTDGENITVDGCTCTVNEEICDNRDNDCDAQIDEDLMKPCENQVGVCVGANRVCRGVASDFAKECEEADY
ncbi:MAG: hypothetical protein VX475_12230, partial [Myxococcota bacterium]|nr:hypothetical protein [Myxococcota bacterium]